jgi:hypothetical protein
VIEEANAWIEPNLSVVEHTLRILDVKERKTRRQSVKMYNPMESSYRRRSYMGN